MSFILLFDEDTGAFTDISFEHERRDAITDYKVIILELMNVPCFGTRFEHTRNTHL